MCRLSPVTPNPAPGGKTMDQPQEYFEQRATRLRPRDSRLELETFSPLAHSMGRMSQPFRAAWGWGVEGKGAAHAGNAVRAIAWRPVHYASGHLKTISFNSFSFLGLLKTTASQAASSSQIRSRLGQRFPARERERGTYAVHLMPIPSAGRVALMCVLNVRCGKGF